MTIFEAKKIIQDYYRIGSPNDEQDFMYTEALNFIIHTEKNPRAMLELGGWYYEKRDFDKAAKYYELAAECGEKGAYSPLGYIWYYGRTGVKDYEKAFKYYNLAADNGDDEAAYKIADMYKNGYFVEKDYDKYKSIIEKLYKKVKNDRNLWSPLPQISIRLAVIRSEQGKKEDAANLLIYAKDFLAQRIRINSFFGDITTMKWLITELYNVIDFDYHSFDFYDLFHLLKTPVKITFRYKNKEYNVESSEDGELMAVHFGDKWFRSSDEFFNKAVIENNRLTKIYNDLYLFEVR